MESIQFNEIPLRDIYGNKICHINGEFNRHSLSNFLIEQWVGYIECHHCSRCHTCKFSIPNPNFEWKKKEIRCGVKSEFIKNFIDLTFDEYAAEKEIQESLLSATYYLAEYVKLSEQQIGMAIDVNWLDNLGKYGKSFLANLIHLRDMLILAAQDLSHFPNLYRVKPILLVEGQSEKTFLDKLRESHSSWFMGLRTEVYGGNGNAHPRRIQMRLDKYIEDGYICYMQGDKDGKEKGHFEKLINQGTVKKENTFLFTFDFETSIPRSLLLKVLHNLELLSEVDVNEFKEKTDKSSSICKQIKAQFSLDIEPYKVKIADELAWTFNNTAFYWYQDKHKFMEETELGRFLDFVIKMR